MTESAKITVFALLLKMRAKKKHNKKANNHYAFKSPVSRLDRATVLNSLSRFMYPKRIVA